MFQELQKKWRESISYSLTEDDFCYYTRELLSWQVKNNPVYQDYCRLSGIDLKSKLEWHEFPALPVRTFRQKVVSCLPESPFEQIFLTSGTSEEQRGKQHLISTNFYHLSLKMNFDKNLPKNQKADWISLIPSSSELPQSSLSHMISYLAKAYQPPKMTYCCNASFEIDYSIFLGSILDAIQKQTPIALFATSFALVQVCDYLSKNRPNLSLHKDSFLFETGGSKGRVREISRFEMQTLLAQTLDLQKDQIHYEYGMTELSSQCYALATNEVFDSPPWMQVQIINPKNGEKCPPGQRGLLHFYDLANTYTCAAIATEDYGEYVDDSGRFLLHGRTPSTPPRGCSLPYEITS
ncbi:MAG: hypothetical protein AAGA18_02460 [Verrucomicrobiota bacterium]